MARTTALDAAATSILALCRDRPVRVLIDGRSASGKSTFSQALCERLADAGRRVAIIHFDNFHPAGYRPRGSSAYTPSRYLEEGFDFDAFERLVLEPTKPGGERRIALSLPGASQDGPRGSIGLADDGVLLVEGAFLLKPALRHWWDFAIWLDISFPTMVARATERDTAWVGDAAKVRTRYEGFWTETHSLYEVCGAREAANAVIDNEDPTDPRLLRLTMPSS